MRCPACQSPDGVHEPDVGAVRCDRCEIRTFVDASGEPGRGAPARALAALLARLQRERPSPSLRPRFVRSTLERHGLHAGGSDAEAAFARGMALAERVDDWSAEPDDGPLEVRRETEVERGGAYRGSARPRVSARRVEWKPTAVPTYVSLLGYGAWMTVTGLDDPGSAGWLGGAALFVAALAWFVRSRLARRVEVRGGRVIVRVGRHAQRWALDELAWVSAARHPDERGWQVQGCVGEEVKTLVDGAPSEAAARQVVALIEEGMERARPLRLRVAAERAAEDAAQEDAEVPHELELARGAGGREAG